MKARRVQKGPLEGVTEGSLEVWSRVVPGGNMNSLGVLDPSGLVSQLMDPISVLFRRSVVSHLVNSLGAGKLSGVNALGDCKLWGVNSRAGSKLLGMMRKVSENVSLPSSQGG
jgi:hypothetical protein